MALQCAIRLNSRYVVNDKFTAIPCLEVMRLDELDLV